MFDELDGIRKARKIKKQEKTVLEVLLGLSHSMVERYNKESYELSDHTSAHRTYLSMSKEADKLPSFNENDIISLVHTLGSVDTQFSEDEQKHLLGMYTGILVDTLSKRNKEQGKKTIISIEDVHLDYLFSFVQNTYVISIRNSTGDGILDRAACFGGFINYIFLDGINAKYGLGQTIGGTEGGDGSVAVMQIKNSNSSEIACFSTVTELLTIENCTGDKFIEDSGFKKVFLKNISAEYRLLEIEGEIAKSLNRKNEDKYVELFVLQNVSSGSIFYNPEDNRALIDIVLLKNLQINNIYTHLFCDKGNNIYEFVYLSNITNRNNTTIYDVLVNDDSLLEKLEKSFFFIEFIIEDIVSEGSSNFVRVLMDDIIYGTEVLDNLDNLEPYKYKKKLESLLHQASPEFKKVFCDYSIDKIYDLFNAIPFGIENIPEIESKLKEIDTVYKSIQRI